VLQARDRDANQSVACCLGSQAGRGSERVHAVGREFAGRDVIADVTAGDGVADESVMNSFGCAWARAM
jgi:hypothetical protein